MPLLFILILVNNIFITMKLSLIFFGDTGSDITICIYLNKLAHFIISLKKKIIIQITFFIPHFMLYITFLIICPVENIDMANADHLPQVDPPSCLRVIVVSRDRTLTSRCRTIRVISIHRILTSIVLICIWPWMLFPCRSP